MTGLAGTVGMAERIAALAAQVVDIGATRGLTVAVAESLTGGAVCAAIVSVPGASRVLRGGVVSYATDVKAALLGVDPGLLARRGAVDPEVAVAMASGVRRVCGAAVAVATTGVAGPDGQDGRVPGEVYVAVAGPAGADVEELRLPGDRCTVRANAVAAALDALGRTMASLPMGPAGRS